MSQIFAQFVNRIQGCFGTLFFCILVFSNPSTTFASEIHQKYSSAVSHDIESTTADAIEAHLRKIGLSPAAKADITSFISFEYLANQPYIKEIILNIDLPQPISDMALSDTTMFLQGWFKEQGYNATPQAVGTVKQPSIKLNFYTKKSPDFFSDKIKSYLIIIACIIFPVFFLFLALGVTWQMRYYLALKKSAKLPTLTSNQPYTNTQAKSEHSNHRLHTIFEKEDLKAMFQDMTFNQAVGLIGSLDDVEKYAFMEGLNLKKPVQQLILDKIKLN